MIEFQGWRCLRSALLAALAVVVIWGVALPLAKHSLHHIFADEGKDTISTNAARLTSFEEHTLSMAAKHGAKSDWFSEACHGGDKPSTFYLTTKVIYHRPGLFIGELVDIQTKHILDEIHFEMILRMDGNQPKPSCLDAQPLFGVFTLTGEQMGDIMDSTLWVAKEDRQLVAVVAWSSGAVSSFSDEDPGVQPTLERTILGQAIDVTVAEKQ